MNIAATVRIPGYKHGIADPKKARIVRYEPVGEARREIKIGKVTGLNEEKMKGENRPHVIHFFAEVKEDLKDRGDYWVIVERGGDLIPVTGRIEWKEVAADAE